MSSSKSFLKKWGSFFDYRKPSQTSTMDILVVKSKNGELRSSSFHVTFGWKILKPANKVVDLIVNNKVCPVKMKLSSKRKAFFEIPDVYSNNYMNWSTDCNQSEDDIIMINKNDLKNTNKIEKTEIKTENKQVSEEFDDNR